jgi:hypothetical protein
MNAGKKDTPEVVLEIGAEAGSLSIQRVRALDGTRKFILIVDESALAEFLDKADQTDLVKRYPPVDTFEEALQFMDNYPWHKMQLVKVYPEYADFIASMKLNSQPLKRSKFMNPSGRLTSTVAQSIAGKLKDKGFVVYYDHDTASDFAGTIAVSIARKLSREKEISQLDIAVVEEISNQAIALVEIEETTDNPKKLIGDIFATLMGNSNYLPGGEKVFVGEWTSLIIFGKGEGHAVRNRDIQKKVMGAKYALGTVNASMGNIVVKSLQSKDDLEKVLMKQINLAIQRYDAFKSLPQKEILR